VSASKSVL
jgi:hypothetical protein